MISVAESLAGQSIREDKRAAETAISTALHPFGSQARKECVAIMVAPTSKQVSQARLRTGDWATWTPRLPLTDMERWACDADERGVWTEFRARCFPLIEFPDYHLVEIRLDVESSVKPPYWLDLGLAQIPSRSWYEWHWQRGIDPDARRPAIPTWVRAQVLERDGLVCQICQLEVDPADVHLDHIKPWSRGGEHSVKNLRVAHSLCNMRKAARWDEDA